jgi:predicted peroxiredoxin
VAKSLGVFVSSDQHLDKIIKLCKAAKDKDVDVTIFFSHLGTLLTQEKKFDELKGLARMALCKVAFESQGLHPPVPGIGEKEFATQARHAEVIGACDRYVVF